MRIINVHDVIIMIIASQIALISRTGPAESTEHLYYNMMRYIIKAIF